MTAYLRPRSIAEACDATAAHPDWMLLAGATDLMVSATHRPVPPGIIDLWRLPGLGGIALDGDAVRIGAGTTWLEVTRAPEVHAHAPILAAAAREIGALQIQARGTVGGNVGTSSPVGDSLPVLLALDAEIELQSVRGTRRVAYASYCTGYRRTVRDADELITCVRLPRAPGWAQHWRKVGTRRAQSISKVMAAVAIRWVGDVVAEARVALGAVAAQPLRVAAVEAAVRGLRATEAAEAARAALGPAIAPITDVRSTSAYRRDVASNVVARCFGG